MKGRKRHPVKSLFVFSNYCTFVGSRISEGAKRKSPFFEATKDVTVVACKTGSMATSATSESNECDPDCVDQSQGKQEIRAHKIILAIFSSYFEKFIEDNPQSSVIVITFVSHEIMTDIVQMMYDGFVVSDKLSDLQGFLQASEDLGLDLHNLNSISNENIRSLAAPEFKMGNANSLTSQPQSVASQSSLCRDKLLSLRPVEPCEGTIGAPSFCDDLQNICPSESEGIHLLQESSRQPTEQKRSDMQHHVMQTSTVFSDADSGRTKAESAPPCSQNGQEETADQKSNNTVREQRSMSDSLKTISQDIVDPAVNLPPTKAEPRAVTPAEINASSQSNDVLHEVLLPQKDEAVDQSFECVFVPEERASGDYAKSPKDTSNSPVTTVADGKQATQPVKETLLRLRDINQLLAKCDDEHSLKKPACELSFLSNRFSDKDSTALTLRSEENAGATPAEDPKTSFRWDSSVHRKSLSQRGPFHKSYQQSYAPRTPQTTEHPEVNHEQRTAPSSSSASACERRTDASESLDQPHRTGRQSASGGSKAYHSKFPERLKFEGLEIPLPRQPTAVCPSGQSKPNTSETFHPEQSSNVASAKDGDVSVANKKPTNKAGDEDNKGQTTKNVALSSQVRLTFVEKDVEVPTHTCSSSQEVSARAKSSSAEQPSSSDRNRKRSGDSKNDTTLEKGVKRARVEAIDRQVPKKKKRNKRKKETKKVSHNKTRSEEETPSERAGETKDGIHDFDQNVGRTKSRGDKMVLKPNSEPVHFLPGTDASHRSQGSIGTVSRDRQQDFDNLDGRQTLKATDGRGNKMEQSHVVGICGNSSVADFTHEIYSTSTPGARHDFTTGQSLPTTTIHTPQIHPVHCEFCPQSFSNRHQKMWHDVEVHKCGFKCEVCLKLFVSQDAREQHRRTVHPVQCSRCGKRFPSDELLTSHLSRYHFSANPSPRAPVVEKTEATKETQLTCLHCDKVFATEMGRKLHVKIEHKTLSPAPPLAASLPERQPSEETRSSPGQGQEAFDLNRTSASNRMCQHCGHVWMRDENMEGHLCPDHLTCRVCSKDFHNCGQLLIHLKESHRSYWCCKLCGEIFKHSAADRLHRQFHHKHLNHKQGCDYCGCKATDDFSVYTHFFKECTAEMPRVW